MISLFLTDVYLLNYRNWKDKPFTYDDLNRSGDDLEMCREFYEMNDMIARVKDNSSIDNINNAVLMIGDASYMPFGDYYDIECQCHYIYGSGPDDMISFMASDTFDCEELDMKLRKPVYGSYNPGFIYRKFFFKIRQQFELYS